MQPAPIVTPWRSASPSRCSRSLFWGLIYFCSRNTGGNRFGFVFREDDEAGLDGRDLAREVVWVRLIEDPGKFDRAVGLHDLRIEDPLVRGARFVIDPCLLTVLVRTPVGGFRRRGSGKRVGAPRRYSSAPRERYRLTCRAWTG